MSGGLGVTFLARIENKDVVRVPIGILEVDRLRRIE